VPVVIPMLFPDVVICPIGGLVVVNDVAILNSICFT